jgi:hypothetical protein
MTAGCGAALTLDSSAFALTLLRETLVAWAEAIVPYFTKKAKDRWRSEWEKECSSLLSANMQRHVTKKGIWDVYRLVSVLARHPTIFLPNFDELSDCLKELYRQVSGFL